MHPHLNSSNLVPPVPEQLGQFRGKLAQFCGNRAIVCGEQQDIPFQIHHMAGACQRGRGNLFVVPLQYVLLRDFVGQPVQFRAGVEI